MSISLVVQRSLPLLICLSIGSCGLLQPEKESPVYLARSVYHPNSPDLESLDDNLKLNISLTREAYDPDEYGVFRMDGETPSYVLAELSVVMGMWDVSPPKRLYQRFGDPVLDAKVTKSSKGLTYIYISGGDGGGAHERRFAYKGNKFRHMQYRNPITGEFSAPQY